VTSKGSMTGPGGSLVHSVTACCHSSWQRVMAGGDASPMHRHIANEGGASTVEGVSRQGGWGRGFRQVGLNSIQGCVHMHLALRKPRDQGVLSQV
jgi:hypothetical protein